MMMPTLTTSEMMLGQQQQQFQHPHSPTGGSSPATSMPSPNQQQPQQPQEARKKTTGPLHNPRYKSILCDHWERNNGTCPYAEKCQFAHGPAELAKWQAHRARQQQMQQQQPHFALPTKPVMQTSPVVPALGHMGGGMQAQAHLAQLQQQQQQHQQQVAYLQQQQQALLSGMNGGMTLPLQQQQPTTSSKIHPSQQHFQQSMMATQQQQMNSISYNPQLHVSPVKPQAQTLMMQQDLFASPTTSSPMYNTMIPQSPASQFVPSPPQQNLYATQQLSQQQFVQQQQLKMRSSSPQPRGSNGFDAILQQQQQQQNQFIRGNISPGTRGNPQVVGGSARQTPANSISSISPSSSPFPASASAMAPSSSSAFAALPSLQQHRRSLSPDDSLELRSHPQELETPRSGDPRRTASLPQLFSRDFLSSLKETNDTSSVFTTGTGPGAIESHQAFSTTSTSRLSNLEQYGQTLSNGSGGGLLPSSSAYSGYRRGSAPPVVLSVVTNSLADLDSLADEFVSEPATSASQLFNMPTVFPGSIKGSINEYL